MPTTLSPGEEAQLAQTIEMFEVITQSQPQDYQSLEILKEAYSKLGREGDVVSTSKRIAEAYVQMGQLSSAILEYETILQRFPQDTAVQEALKTIESKAHSFPGQNGDTVMVKKTGDTAQLLRRTAAQMPLVDIDDGRKPMFKLLVESKTIAAADFDQVLAQTRPDEPAHCAGRTPRAAAGRKEPFALRESAENAVGPLALRLFAASPL